MDRALVRAGSVTADAIIHGGPNSIARISTDVVRNLASETLYRAVIYLFGAPAGAVLHWLHGLIPSFTNLTHFFDNCDIRGRLEAMLEARQIPQSASRIESFTSLISSLSPSLAHSVVMTLVASIAAMKFWRGSPRPLSETEGDDLRTAIPQILNNPAGHASFAPVMAFVPVGGLVPAHAPFALHVYNDNYNAHYHDTESLLTGDRRSPTEVLTHPREQTLALLAPPLPRRSQRLISQGQTHRATTGIDNGGNEEATQRVFVKAHWRTPRRAHR